MVRGNRSRFVTRREGRWGPPGPPQEALYPPPRWRARRESQRLQLRLRLLQVEAHVHLAIHRRRGGEVLLRLLALARAAVELAEPEVAVGDEGAHAERVSERERVTVVAVGVSGGVALSRDVTEDAEGP